MWVQAGSRAGHTAFHQSSGRQYDDSLWRDANRGGMTRARVPWGGKIKLKARLATANSFVWILPVTCVSKSGSDTLQGIILTSAHEDLFNSRYSPEAGWRRALINNGTW